MNWRIQRFSLFISPYLFWKLLTTRSFWIKNNRPRCAPSAAQNKKGALGVRRQQEDGSAPRNPSGWSRQRSPRPKSCTSTRAVGSSLRDSSDPPAQSRTKCSSQKHRGSPAGISSEDNRNYWVEQFTMQIWTDPFQRVQLKKKRNVRWKCSGRTISLLLVVLVVLGFVSWEDDVKFFWIVEDCEG